MTTPARGGVSVFDSQRRRRCFLLLDFLSITRASNSVARPFGFLFSWFWVNFGIDRSDKVLFSTSHALCGGSVISGHPTSTHTYPQTKRPKLARMSGVLLLGASGLFESAGGAVENKREKLRLITCRGLGE